MVGRPVSMVYRVRFESGDGTFVRTHSIKSRRAVRRAEDFLSHQCGSPVFAREARDGYGNLIPVFDIPLNEVK